MHAPCSMTMDHLFSICNSSHINALATDRSVRIDALKEGDRVLTASGFQDYLGTFHANMQSQTLVLETQHKHSSTHSVELTYDHLIATTAGFKFAGQVTIGESLIT